MCCFGGPCNRESLDEDLRNIHTNLFLGNRFVGTVENGSCPCYRHAECGCRCECGIS